MTDCSLGTGCIHIQGQHPSWESDWARKSFFHNTRWSSRLLSGTEMEKDVIAVKRKQRKKICAVIEPESPHDSRRFQPLHYRVCQRVIFFFGGWGGGKRGKE